MKYCSKCGQLLYDDTVFCVACGCNQYKNTVVKDIKVGSAIEVGEVIDELPKSQDNVAEQSQPQNYSLSSYQPYTVQSIQPSSQNHHYNYGNPFQYPFPYPNPYPYGYNNYSYPQKQKSPDDSYGLAGMILGLISLALISGISFFTLFISIPGLVFSAVGLSKCNKNGIKGVKSLVGLICSIVNTVICITLFFIIIPLIFLFGIL